LGSNGKKVIMDVPYNDEKLDVSTVPLGYCQASEETVIYMSRRPTRMYKQGISGDSLTMRWIGTGGHAKFSFSYVSQPFEDMILGKYPSLNDAFLKLRKATTDREIAISRDTALKFNPNQGLIYVYFKGDEVGWIIPNTNIIVIPSSDLAWIVTKHLNEFSWEIR
jgi:hypothetical protein